MKLHTQEIDDRSEVPAELPQDTGKHTAFESHAEEGGEWIVRPVRPAPPTPDQQDKNDHHRCRQHLPNAENIEPPAEPGVGPIADLVRLTRIEPKNARFI